MRDEGVAGTYVGQQIPITSAGWLSKVPLTKLGGHAVTRKALGAAVGWSVPTVKA